MTLCIKRKLLDEIDIDVNINKMLEEIFSELYVECVGESNIVNKEKVKKTNKKKTKTSKK